MEHLEWRKMDSFFVVWNYVIIDFTWQCILNEFERKNNFYAILFVYAMNLVQDSKCRIVKMIKAEIIFWWTN